MSGTRTPDWYREVWKSGKVLEDDEVAEIEVRLAEMLKESIGKLEKIGFDHSFLCESKARLVASASKAHERFTDARLALKDVLSLREESEEDINARPSAERVQKLQDALKGYQEAHVDWAWARHILLQPDEEATKDQWLSSHGALKWALWESYALSGPGEAAKEEKHPNASWDLSKEWDLGEDPIDLTLTLVDPSKLQASESGTETPQPPGLGLMSKNPSRLKIVARRLIKKTAELI